MINRLLRSFDFRFEGRSLLRPSVLALLAGNLFPVAGVILFGWNVFLLLVLFWMENLVVGLYTVLKMLFVSRDNASWAARVSATVFFCVHYGLFTSVHGVFVFVVFGGDTIFAPETASIWDTLMGYQLGWGALALFASHGVSFLHNYLGSGENKHSNLSGLMQQPYGRVVILHLTIIFGGFFVMILGSPVFGLLFLVVLKTVIDIRAHLREHDRYTAQKAVTI